MCRVDVCRVDACFQNAEGIPFIEPGHHVLVSLCAVAGMYVHGECVELLQGGHGAEQHHHHAPSLHRLHRACQQVGSEGLKIL